MQIGPYIIDEIVHETHGSVIYACHRKSDGEKFVLKEFRFSFVPDEIEKAKFEQEYDILKDISAKGVIKAYDLIVETGHIAIVLEDFGAVSLGEFLQDTSVGRLNIESFLTIATSIAKTLSDLHQNGIIHLDIKPANVLLTKDLDEIKLGDFGLSRSIANDQLFLFNPEFIGGTLPYISPEQTGRMNRGIDHRSDIYSLGITLFEMLTGQRPFAYDDPLQLIHAHIAKQPPNPRQRVASIPAVVADIILKCIAKSPDDRYQNSSGLYLDLMECQKHLEERGVIETFPLARRDVPLRLEMPDKLYGRDDQVSLLKLLFSGTVAQQNLSLCFVSGESGSGKTRVVREIQEPLVGERGYLASGKYDALKHDDPYSGFVQAIREVIGQILVETDERIGRWKSTFLSALGGNGQLLVEIVPDLELIIGPQPPVPELDPDQTRSRFLRVVTDFVGAIATRNHPLVLFLDDIQWADMASITLIDAITENLDNKCLFIVLAFRNNEVDSAHGLMVLLKNLGIGFEDLGNTGILVPTQGGRKTRMASMRTDALSLESINQLLSDVLALPLSKTGSLAEIIERKTGGNPYFINQFVVSLYEQKILKYGPSTGWQWNESLIEALTVTDNVVGLVTEKLASQPPLITRVLSTSAAIGTIIDIRLVAQITGVEYSNILVSLADAAHLGFLERRDQEYTFAHDSIKEAAYHLMSQGEKESLHYRIGMQLLKNGDPTSADGLNEPTANLFKTVDHLNYGRAQISSGDETIHLARLNLLAGRAAIQSSAPGPASSYLGHGIELLDDDAWDEQYSLAYDLHRLSVEALYLSGEYDSLERMIGDISEKIRDDLDRVPIDVFRIRKLIATDNEEEALDYGLMVLSKLGISLPSHPGTGQILYYIARVRLALSAKTYEDVVAIPDMVDRRMELASRILMILGYPAYHIRIKLLPILIMRSLLIFLKHGYGCGANYALAAFAGVIMIGALKNFAAGKMLFQAAKAIGARPYLRRYEGRTAALELIFLRHRETPLNHMLSELMKTHTLCLALGDPEFACNTGHNFALHGNYSSRPFQEAIFELLDLRRTLEVLKQDHILGLFDCVLQHLINLSENDPEPKPIVGDFFDERKASEEYERLNKGSALAFLHLFKMESYYIFGRFDDALASAKVVSDHLDFFNGFFAEFVHFFFETLSRLAKTRAETRADTQRGKQSTISRRARARIRSRLANISQRFDSGKSNFTHKALLIEGELARVEGNAMAAIKKYAQGIKEASAHGFIREEAIGYELLAQLYLDEGLEDEGNHNLALSLSCYQRWGASGKVTAMRRDYPHLVALSQSREYDSQSDTIVLSSPDLADPNSRPNLGSSNSAGTEKMTLSVSSLSIALSGETDFQSVIARIVDLTLRTSGAEKSFLLIRDQSSGDFKIEGYEDTEGTTVTMQSTSWKTSSALPASVIRYVIRTKSSVNLGNASADGTYSLDPYIKRQGVKSLLCLPMLRMGQIDALIYLENNQSIDVFGKEQVASLVSLSKHAGVALRTAYQFKSLRDRLHQKTVDLENLVAKTNAEFEDIVRRIESENSALGHEIRKIRSQ